MPLHLVKYEEEKSEMVISKVELLDQSRLSKNSYQ